MQLPQGNCIGRFILHRAIPVASDVGYKRKEVLWNNSARSAAGTAAGKVDDLVFSGGFL